MKCCTMCNFLFVLDAVKYAFDCNAICRVGDDVDNKSSISEKPIKVQFLMGKTSSCKRLS